MTTEIKTPPPAKESGDNANGRKRNTIGTGAQASIDVSRLDNVHHTGGKTIAACPACREAGHDKTGNHLFIGADGRFGCIQNRGADGDQHRRRIFELVGTRDTRHQTTTAPATKRKKETTIHATVDAAVDAAIWGLNQSGGQWSETSRHAYQDQHGAIYAYTTRLDPQDTQAKKQVRPISPNGNGYSIQDPEKWFPYRFNELDADGPVHVFEGEKCVDAAASIKLINAITSSHGARSASDTDWSCLAGRDVVIHPDNDDEGRAYANDVARLVLNLDPPGRPMIAHPFSEKEKYDVADLIAEKGAEALPVIIGAAFDAVEVTTNADETPDQSNGLPQSVDVTLWHDADLPPPDPVLADAFDLATKALVVGPSKARKSFFLLQMLLSIAAGRDSFLGWEIKQARRVLFLNLEIPPAHFQRRVRRMMHAMGMTPADLAGRFHLINARGLEPRSETTEQIIDRCQSHGAEIVCADPIYKLLEGDESKQEHVKPLLRLFDQIANESGATVLYSHHGTKGIAGDRQTIDRAAGSGLLARDFDWMASLAHHQTHRESGLLVVEQIARSYPPRNAFCIRWDDAGLFVLDEAEPVLLTSKNARQDGKAGPSLTPDDALDVVVNHGAMFAGMFHEALRQKGFTERAARNVTEQLLTDGRLSKLVTGYPRKVTIGTPTQIECKKSEASNANQ